MINSITQFLLPLCLFIVGVTTFPNKHGNRNHSEDNRTTKTWNMKSELLTTINSLSSDTQTSVPWLPEITQISKTTPEHILYITGEGDYYEDDDSEEEGPTNPPHSDVLPCPYDRCKHLEPPCEDIQIRLGGNCLCPGLTGPWFPPDSPRVGQITPTERGASVMWCSPLSFVLYYRVLYKTNNGPMERGPILNATYRFFSIGNLLPDTSYRVCLVAINEAGESQVEEGDDSKEGKWENGTPGPCRLFRTITSQGSHIYLGGGIGLAVLASVLGLIVFGYWLWRRKRVESRKWLDNDETGIANMTFKTESVEQL
ncbi:LRRN4 C-terminal-like protein [Spea bombifrons]|uniref:LRRN4 C-terminal-like protein n=1 Tax=Spea bombifrons TaxID=233779 RepID=UPI00234942BD|nr:LRRN4 C-terminal-like protein [Spea bombifrons]